MGCGTGVSCWLPGRTQMGDSVQKKNENQMRADSGPGEEGTNGVLSPFTSFCACAAAEPWPQETPSDIKMD